MNLLLVQDALKNASDQQLAQMMQSPDSSAPSYLVLSEIRRRKDMRRQQPQVSNRTVADDLTAPEDQGIRGLQPAMGQPQEQAPQEVDDQAGIEAMREGGVVRMQAGGQPPGRRLSEMDVGELRRYLNPMPGFNPPPGMTPLDARLELARRGMDPAGFAEIQREAEAAAVGGIYQPPPPPSNFVPPQADMREDEGPVGVQQAPAPAPSAAAAPEASRANPLRGMTENYGEGVPSFAPPAAPAPNAAQAPAGGEAAPTQAQPAQAAATPSPGRAAPAGGGGGGGDGLPTLAEVYRRNAELFPDTMGGIRQRMEEGRIDPAARRQEAVNMALIEAGLRIAGSRNPSLIGAIGEGALPAVQSYGQQLGQIRSEQRQALRDDLELAKQEVNRQYAIGQISAAEHRSRMEIISQELRAARAEAGADRRAGRAEAAADRRFEREQAILAQRARLEGRMSFEEFNRLPPEQQRSYLEFQGRGRADVSGLAPVLNAAERRLTDLRAEFDNLPSAPSQTSWNSPNPRYTEWVRRRDELRSRIAQEEGRVRDLEERLYYGRGSSQQNRTPSATAPNTTGERPPLSSFMGQ